MIVATRLFQSPVSKRTAVRRSVDAAAQAYQRDGAVYLQELYTKQEVVRIANALAEIYNDFIKQITHQFADCSSDTKCGFAEDGSPYMFYGQHSVAMRRRGTVSFSLLSRDISEFKRMYDLPHLAKRIGPIICTRQIRHWQDEVFVKDPQQNNPTPWHHDEPAWPFKGEMVPTLWIALTDIAANGSALRTIRGSHRDFPALFPPPRDAHLKLEPGYSAAPDFDRLIADGKVEVQTWELRAGDGVLFHPRTIHGALGNQSKVQRIAVSHRWLGERVRYEPDKYSINEPMINASAKRRDAHRLFPVSWAA